MLFKVYTDYQIFEKISFYNYVWDSTENVLKYAAWPRREQTVFIAFKVITKKVARHIDPGIFIYRSLNILIYPKKT